MTRIPPYKSFIATVIAVLITVVLATPAGAGVKFNEYPLALRGDTSGWITAGPDGATWFTEFYSNKIGRGFPGEPLTDFVIPTPSLARAHPPIVLSGAGVHPADDSSSTKVFGNGKETKDNWSF